MIEQQVNTADIWFSFILCLEERKFQGKPKPLIFLPISNSFLFNHFLLNIYIFLLSGVFILSD